MNEVIIYILKVMSIHGLLYLFYRFVLRNSGRHSFNRIYLLSSILAAFLIPLIAIPLPERTPSDEEISVIMWLSEPVNEIEEFELVPVQKQESSSSYWHLVPWLYAAIAIALLIRSVFYLALLSKLKKHSEYVKKRWFKLFKISQDRPFSFFSNVFMPKSLFGTEAFDQILAHECEHVRQLHSIDRLLMDFVVSLFWFSPFIYLYRNALIEIHEFQADEVVLDRFKDPVGYQEILFSQLQSAQYSGLVSHFNFSMIKKRIVMMNKQHKKTGWIYVLTVPVTLMVIFAFSSKEAMQPISEVGDEIAAILDQDELGLQETLEDEPQTKTDLNGEQQENVPDILPIKKSGNVRFTSGFGKRRHPIDKVIKLHKGADFACPIGTEIIAPADGKVTEVKTFEGGYGKLITIEHGSTYKTRFAQLSEFKVKVGDEVKKGDVIGLSGSSGMSTAPHLHYEVLQGDKHVDPLEYIKDYNFKAKLGSHADKEEHTITEEESLLAQQEMELAKHALAKAREEEMRAHEEMLKAERDAMKAMHQQELELERERSLAELEKERLEEERKLMELKMLNEKLKLEENKQNEALRFEGKGGGPLLVVDGEIVDTVSNLVPTDIAEVHVLKGESAKTKYGGKGSDGVVEITTKGKNKDKKKSKGKKKSKSKTKSKN